MDDIRAMIAELERDAQSFDGKTTALIAALKDFADARESVNALHLAQLRARGEMAGVIVEAAGMILDRKRRSPSRLNAWEYAFPHLLK